jgi:uncharacterized protein (TIGR03032 family)
MTARQPSDADAEQSQFEITVSRHFATWLAEQRVSLAFTNPPLKLFLVGLRENGQLSLFERTFRRCRGIAAVSSDTLYISSNHQIWRLENALPPGQITAEGYDRQYIPRKVYTTGAVGTHDVAVDAAGRVLFVNTRFGCLARVSDQYSFVPLWRPPFLLYLRPGDRSHLSGLALRDGHLAFVTSATRTDVPDPWRDHRRMGGSVINIATNEIVAADLCMPDSPRWYRDRLWLPMLAPASLVGSIS